MIKDLNHYLRFLDCLRVSGKINMWGSPKVLRESYKELTKNESFEIFNLWAKDTKRHKMKAIK